MKKCANLEKSYSGLCPHALPCCPGDPGRETEFREVGPEDWDIWVEGLQDTNQLLQVKRTVHEFKMLLIFLLYTCYKKKNPFFWNKLT